MKEVYDRLGHHDLLQRCLRGQLQNPNESLHSVIWGKCPKTGFVGLQRVAAATCSGVAQFNSGIELNMCRVFTVMDIVPGTHMVKSAVTADKVRLEQLLRKAAASTKNARRARRLARVVSQSAADSDYASGAFCVMLFCHRRLNTMLLYGLVCGIVT